MVIGQRSVNSEPDIFTSKYEQESGSDTKLQTTEIQFKATWTQQDL